MSSRYTEEQIIGIMKQHQAGLGAKELCLKYGISDCTFYKLRSKYGEMEVSDALKLKALEEENRKLKKLLAETVLDAATVKEMLGQKLLTPGARRVAVSCAINDKGYTQRRACQLVGLDSKVYRYAPKKPDDEALRQRLKELAS